MAVEVPETTHHASPPTTHRALLIPEIVEQIFLALADWDNHYDPEEGRRSARAQKAFACVNRIFAGEALPHLWKTAASFGGRLTLSRTLSKIEPLRRQFYANLIVEGSAWAYASRLAMTKERDAAGVIEGLSFPRLRTLHLYIYPCDDSIPRIDGHNVSTLLLYPRRFRHPGGHFEFVETEHLLSILEQAYEMFPNVQVVKILGLCEPEALSKEELAIRWPRLEVFEHSEEAMLID
ncbi:hypothetical protein KEM55_004038 [Ascosphaera atra]|nr:hypothetical protein KEM55_004038 [Ascosphaera atra]